MKKLLFLLICLPLFSIAQKKQITLEDIYKSGTFRSESVPGFEPEKLDSFLNADDVKDEKGEKLSLSDFTLSIDKKRVLISINREKIYRHSSKAIIYLHDILSKKTIKLSDSKILHPSFSPDGTKVAFVKNNNLFIYDINSSTETPVTTDGKWNEIINGNCDWVYEEEFSFTQAYQWSANGKYLAYYRFDERLVKEYNLILYDNTYNKDYKYKYPKAGDDNSVVEIHIYNVLTGQNVNAQFEKGDIYIPRIKWSKNENSLIVFWLNRHQNNLKLLSTNAQTGTSTLMYEESNKYYVEVEDDDWNFLNDGKQFLFASEMSGYKHLYLYSFDGKIKMQLTKGVFGVTEINSVDEKNKLVYYTLAYPTPMDRNLFVTDFSGKYSKQLTQGSGWHRTVFNESMTQFKDYYSSLNTPQSVYMNTISISRKKEVVVKESKLENDNAKLKTKLLEYEINNAEFIRVPNSKGDTLNGWMLKPTNFDATKKYPVLFCNYGGPGSQQVANRFGAVNFWHHLLSQKGFIIVSVDNTGTGFRGEEFKKKTYLQLGKFEIEDQIDAAKYIGNLSFVDKTKIGHWGWSYGGFMSSLAITKGADVFSAAIAVAPVTSWRYYDNIYTERFMRTPKENPKGYDDNSPINFVDKIKGKYLIIHGTGDDNVHFQNSVMMVESMIQKNIDFESAYYPNKDHGIRGGNTTFHLYSKMTNWLLYNLGNSNVSKSLSK